MPLQWSPTRPNFRTTDQLTIIYMILPVEPDFLHMAKIITDKP